MAMRRFFVRVRLLPYISLFAAAVVRIMTLGRAA